jgi:putative copper export protein
MSPLWLATAATHWLGFLALAGLIGSLALETVVLPASPPDLARASERLRRWRASCLIGLLASTSGELVIRAHTMAGGGIVSALGATPTVLALTKFGRLWIARFVMLGLALLISGAGGRGATITRAVLALGVALTTSLTGHAADWGDLSWSVAIDWIHVVAATTWTGGLIGLTLIMFTQEGEWTDGVLGAAARRFSRLAGWCLLTVVVSGTYSTWLQVRQLSSMWTTAYGRILGAKLLVALVLASCGAINRYRVLPRLVSGATVSTAASGFRAYVGLEALLAVVVFACTAVLIDVAPARHMRHREHSLEMDRPPHAGTLPACATIGHVSARRAGLLEPAARDRVVGCLPCRAV